MAGAAPDPSAWPEERLRSFAVRVPPVFDEVERFRHAEALQVKPSGDAAAWLDIDHRSSYRLRSEAADWRDRFEEDLLGNLTDLYTTVYRADCARLHRTARTIDGKPAIDLAYRVLDRGWDGQTERLDYYRWVGVLAQGHVYTIAFRCAFADRDAYGPLVDALVDSFRQTAPLKPAEPPPPPLVPTPAQQRARYTRADVEALLDPGASRYDPPSVHVVLPALGGGLTEVQFDGDDADREPVDLPANGVTDGHVALLNRLVAFDAAARARIEALLFEHYRLCAGTTDYGVVKNSVGDPFDLPTPVAAYERAHLHHAALSADGHAATFAFYPVWEGEHGCPIEWRDGELTRTEW